jgi:hypothetical protein
MTNTHPALPPEVETLGQFLEQTYSTYDIPNHLIQTMNHIDIIELDQDFVPIKESWKPREVASWKKLTQGFIDQVAGRRRQDRLAIALGHYRDFVLAKNNKERAIELEGCKSQLAKLHYTLTHPMKVEGTSIS